MRNKSLDVLGNFAYEVTAKGSMCSDSIDEATSEDECQEAATKLGLQWGRSFNGPNNTPRCLYAEDGRNIVYFNLTPNPSGANGNSQYSAICRIYVEEEGTLSLLIFKCLFIYHLSLIHI